MQDGPVFLIPKLCVLFMRLQFSARENGLSCRRNSRRRHRRIGSYRKIGAFGTFFGLSSFIGYGYYNPFIRTGQINRIVFGNTTDEEHFTDVPKEIKISENLSKNKTNEADRNYFCKRLDTKITVQTCLEPEENDSFFSYFSDTWDGLCCENTKSNEFMCCYASLVLSNAFSLSKAQLSNWSLIILSRVIIFLCKN
ncbi:hypothetical protein BpHYR1_041563 [Brachionus plicatilis]|uniref:Uncharacterized protein n=1 Tax=Brachionus plicatilis TaxID=10195 RepID=A0A3M7SRX5_BRAPC|nr:hypothetical protein BpHYR1_041563 [Brachionus plicatilis]